MTRRLTLILTILCLLVPISASTARADSKSIAGQVINETEAGDAIEGVEVTLWTLLDGERIETDTSLTDDEGGFRFDELPEDSDYAYYLRATYEEVTYTQGPLQFAPDQREMIVQMPVYETTVDDTGIAIERAHLLVSVQSESLSIAELYIFVNPGDRTYIGKEELEGRRWTSRFVLPADAFALEIDDGALGGRFLAAKDGFVDREPHWPGRTLVMYQYAIRCTSGKCRLDREITHPIRSLNVLIPDVGIRVEGKGLQMQGRVTAQGQNYLNYMASDLLPGQNLDLSIQLAQPGIMGGNSSTSNIQVLPWILLGLILVALVLGYPFWRQRTPTGADTS
jgi:hypothetical protein